MNPATSEGSGGYDPEHYCNLAAIEDRHSWFRARNAAIRASAAHVCAAFRLGYRVLEIGCGTGNVLRCLESICLGATVIGMDLFGRDPSLHASAPNSRSCKGTQADLPSRAIFT
jgi:cyclopropane fatty-acyl-phospholipid synthase-like methyltransferase